MAAIIAVKRSLLLLARTYFGATERTSSRVFYLYMGWLHFFIFIFTSLFSSALFPFVRPFFFSPLERKKGVYRSSSRGKECSIFLTAKYRQSNFVPIVSLLIDRRKPTIRTIVTPDNEALMKQTLNARETFTILANLSLEYLSLLVSSFLKNQFLRMQKTFNGNTIPLPTYFCETDKAIQIFWSFILT